MEQKAKQEIIDENKKLKAEIQKLNEKILNQELQLNWFIDIFWCKKRKCQKR